MKKIKKFLSLCLAMILIFTSSIIHSSAETVYDEYRPWDSWEAFIGVIENHGYTEDEVKHETINGSRFVYVVDNGEAIILNVRTNYTGPNKSLFFLPTHLGGYPITTLESDWEIFKYCEYPDDKAPNDEAYIAEVDPGLKYVSGIVIPEGYKYIGQWVFALVGPNMTFYLPDNIVIHQSFAEPDAIIVRKPYNMIYSVEPATDTPYAVSYTHLTLPTMAVV